MKFLRQLTIFAIAVLLAGCTKRAHSAPYIQYSQSEGQSSGSSTQEPPLSRTQDPEEVDKTPVPYVPSPLPTLRHQEVKYIVQPGDTLRKIANRYQLLPKQISAANNIKNPSLIYAGQELLIPPPRYSETGPDFKILPDSELVYGPHTVGFDVPQFLRGFGGYITKYEEEVNGELISGIEIILLVARNYSVNPRVLISLLEFQSQWVTGVEPRHEKYPLRYQELGYEGLYRQMSWAANQLNRGYYLWRVNGIASWALPDGINVPIHTAINAGTAGVQGCFSQLMTHEKWVEATSKSGFYTTYHELFGNPFQYAVDPLIPDDLSQPSLQLPFEPGVVWAFTGGPHGGWDSGSAWAALDFAPPPGNLGCVTSDEWVVAAADGPVVRADHGAVVQSLDGDKFAQTGWSLLYMHIEPRDRVKVGAQLKAGDRIGHPSCEGGISTGTHLHLARRYNGEWIPADQNIPFNLGGWVSRGAGALYEGTLEKGTRVIRAEDQRTESNLIQH